MVKIAILGKLQNPPRLVPEFTPEGCGNNQDFCIEHETQAHFTNGEILASDSCL